MTPPERRSVVIHGHFYQPPREDPWTGRVPRQPSAAPFHDWNERIEQECYAAVTAARLLGPDGGLRRTLNTLEWMSFDVGPTLLAWLDQHAPETYRRIIEADRMSCERLAGHGNAMAMACHHTILPLADPRDRRTEILWGIADFRRRFGRDPEGMWLPETAVDSATLGALVTEGIRFTVLAPHQVVSPPPRGLPGRVSTPDGEIAVFVYDGALSHAVAFGDLVRDGKEWAAAMARPTGPGGPSLRTVCTDGETFGHHHAFADMGLAAALDHLNTNSDVRVENFASFLARTPPTHDVELVEPSAWSCAHGVERWRSDCGCRADTGRPPSQAWRAPLRKALESLANELHDVFEAEASDLFADPWAVRDAYGAAVGASPHVMEAFLDRWGRGDLTPVRRERARELLEMERDALRLFTSCAWFFDDVARVEPRQVLTYAAHALELAGPSGRALLRDFFALLSAAHANDPGDGTAADVFSEIRSGRTEAAR